MPQIQSLRQRTRFIHSLKNHYEGVLRCCQRLKGKLQGITRGISKTSFAPGKPITREEMAIIPVGALSEHDSAVANMKKKTAFKDNARIFVWSRGFVIMAVRDGLFKGYPDHGFRPRVNTTRVEACACRRTF
jgi:hypothetical protein